MMPKTKKQKLFVQEYLIDLSATQAARVSAVRSE
jgi:phage terminase small subunit